MSISSPHLAQIPLHSLYALVQPITIPATSPNAKFTNWGQTYTCSPLAVFEPENVYQCQLILELARREGKTVRAVGVGHSPSDLACTSGYMLRTAKLDRVLEVSKTIYLVFVSVCGPFPVPSRIRTTLHHLLTLMQFCFH
jgi:L-gulonolactone oxidase